MLSSEHIWVMILGIFMGLGFIILCIYSVNKLFADKTQDVLVKFILLVFTALVGVFIVDKIIDFKVKLLDEQQNNQLFELIKTLVLMIFSYYFGTQKNPTDNSVGQKDNCSGEK